MILDRQITYIDHKDKTKRRNYQLRHYNSKREQHFISELIPSPALFSYYILWGESTSIRKNIQKLNNKLLRPQKRFVEEGEERSAERPRINIKRCQPQKPMK